MQTILWSSDTFSWRLTQTLAHFLWQGSAIALAVLMLDRLLSQAAASTRYALHLGALLIMAACLPVTFALLDDAGARGDAADRSPETHRVAATTDSSSPDAFSFELRRPADRTDDTEVLPSALAQVEELRATSGIAPPSPAPVPLSDARNGVAAAGPAEPAFGAARLIPYSQLIAGGYLIGVLLMTLRLGLAVRGVQRLRRVSQPLDDRDLLETITQLARRIGLRAAPAVACCREISVPIVIGVLQPLILVPASIASGLAPDQVQALLAHELAHLRRFDPLLNFVQRLIEAALFFHPAVWYISRRASIERESASDDLVLTMGFPRITYADALVRMAELSLSVRRPHWAGAGAGATLAACGDRPSEFKRRVLRLVSGEAPAPRLAPGGALLLWIAVAASLAAPVLVQAWPKPGCSGQQLRE